MKTEIEALLKKARKSLEAAKLLADESYLDFTASRAYYAMFYAAEALLLERGLSFTSHSAVIGAFGKEFAKTALIDIKFHRYLIDAQDFRSLGDYGIGPEITEVQTREIIDWAEEFIDMAEKYLSSVAERGG